MAGEGKILVASDIGTADVRVQCIDPEMQKRGTVCANLNGMLECICAMETTLAGWDAMKVEKPLWNKSGGKAIREIDAILDIYEGMYSQMYVLMSTTAKLMRQIHGELLYEDYKAAAKIELLGE